MRLGYSGKLFLLFFSVFLPFCINCSSTRKRSREEDSRSTHTLSPNLRVPQNSPKSDFDFFDETLPYGSNRKLAPARRNPYREITHHLSSGEIPSPLRLPSPFPEENTAATISAPYSDSDDEISLEESFAEDGFYLTPHEPWNTTHHEILDEFCEKYSISRKTLSETITQMAQKRFASQTRSINPQTNLNSSDFEQYKKLHDYFFKFNVQISLTNDPIQGHVSYNENRIVFNPQFFQEKYKNIYIATLRHFVESGNMFTTATLLELTKRKRKTDEEQAFLSGLIEQFKNNSFEAGFINSLKNLPAKQQKSIRLSNEYFSSLLRKYEAKNDTHSKA